MTSLFPLALQTLAHTIGADCCTELAGTAAGVSTDTRRIAPGEVFFALKGEHFDGHEYLRTAAERGAVAAVVQCSWSCDRPATLPLLEVKDTLWAYGELAAWVRRSRPLPAIGLTGSVGKTGVKEMVAACLRTRYAVHATQGNFNNLVGTPLTILSTPPETEWLVLELGSNQPGEIPRLAELARPRGAIVTAIAPCHLERFGTIEAIITEKGALPAAVPPEGWAVLPATGTGAHELAQRCCCPVVTFGTEAPAEVRAEAVRLEASGCARFQLHLPDGSYSVQLGIPGVHQATLAAAAAAAAGLAGVSGAAIAAALEQVQAISGRMQVRSLAGGVTLIGDYYNASPLAVMAALELLMQLPGGRRVAVLGDMFELGSEAEHWHRMVGRKAGACGLDRLVAVGPLSRHTLEGAEQAGLAAGGGLWVTDTEAAAAQIPALVREADTLLLKASRGMAFEKVAAAVMAQWPPEEQVVNQVANGSGGALPSQPDVYIH